jgi:hypothetical protein
MGLLYAIPAAVLLSVAVLAAVGGALYAQSTIHHRFDGSAFVAHNEVGGIIIVVVASLYAVLLGFMTVVAWEHFQESRDIVVIEADACIDAWHTAVGLPAPVRQQVRRDMTAYADIMVSQEWSAMKRGASVPSAAMISMDAMNAVGGFVPTNWGEANAQSATMQQLSTMHDARQRRIASNDAGLAGFEWLVLLLGAGAIIAFCWLFGGTKPTVQKIMTATVAMMLVATLVLLFELQYPFRSGIGIDATAWIKAQRHIQEMQHGAMPGMRD